MELLKKIFSSESKGGRIARTVLQAFIGLLSMFSVVLTVPEVYGWFAGLPLVVQLGGMAAVIGAVSAAQNYAKNVWEKVKGL